ncbi:ATP synthase subunit I [Alteromonas sp. CYL-A6]|uniref:ATP synthase subunit I n=1 Tax=Alteromonas nitratireducens TaxID=3390813 RepID=UPI0034AAD82D
MNNKLAQPGRNLAKKCLIIQVFTAVFLVLVAAGSGSWHSATSVAAGAVISILPSFIFAGFAFRYAGATQNNLVNKSFGQGVRVKLALTIVLFIIAFAGLKASPVEVFIAFALTTASQVFALFRYGSDRTE